MTHAQIHEIGNRPMTPTDRTQLLVEVAASVGRKYASKYPALDASEIATEVTAQALDKWRHISNKLDQAEQYSRTEYEVLHFLLSERASIYCGRQHYAYMMNTATVIYTPQEVRALLREYYYHPDAWTTPSKDSNHATAVDAKSIWANLHDINTALAKVSDKAHDAILSAYGPEDLGLPEPDKRRLAEAITQLTRELNRHLNKSKGSHEGPGARVAMSNADAIYATRKQD